ncbi:MULTISPECIES: N-acetylmuramoyl-L-alanine amidase [unclassified Virgibacillus]|uniref:N-acetylmuramoyl-L-alanine amidase n=1 Tax=unclassified Virgibacillus TaxID=2620237 RepID=UPI0024DF0354|nr:N-acetylmuramoyl-L-alanine amidase [Virgibacillus sp. LDC-1]
MTKIFIDPGHGGSDPGATANGLQEKDVTLAIALKLGNILNNEYEGHTLKFSRTTDVTVSLSTRTNMANNWGANYLVSIHINAGGGTGFESYIHNGSYSGKAETNRLRGYIHDAVVSSTGFRDRGKKEANFHMLRESNMKAVLTENGFVDFLDDANKLKQNSFLEKIARGHASGLARAFGLTPKSGGTQIHIVQQGDTLWSIAQLYQTTVNRLLELNPGIDPDRLQIGQEVVVSGQAPRYHTVVEGDTLWRISQMYNTTVDNLIALNPGIDPQRLQVGDLIRVS